MTATAGGMFPLFTSRFLSKDEDVPVLEQQTSRVHVDPPHLNTSAPKLGKLAGKAPSLRALDLQTLPRDDGLPTELRTRKEKLAHYEQLCSFVGDRLYVGGEVVAKSRDILRSTAITHVINCVGFLYPPYFEDEFTYQTLYLQDTPSEDILCILYDVFDFIENTPNTARVFIHCSQGVSRSTTLAIAYRMWKENRSYEDVFTEVKQLRGVANPNIGFICQLIQWHKHRLDLLGGNARSDSPAEEQKGEDQGGGDHDRTTASMATDVADTNRPLVLYRLAPQSASAHQYLVPKMVQKPSINALDPRGTFILQDGRNATYIWIGASCISQDFIAAAHRVARQLHMYEGCPASAVIVHQGQETDDFVACIARSSMNANETPMSSVRAVRATAPRANSSSNTITTDGISPVAAYDHEYNIYIRPSHPSSNGSDSRPDTARSGRKTPRAEEHHNGMVSPNDRLRKQARPTTTMSLEGPLGSRPSSRLGSESARALDFQELAVRRHAPTLPPRREEGVVAAGRDADRNDTVNDLVVAPRNNDDELDEQDDDELVSSSEESSEDEDGSSLLSASEDEVDDVSEDDAHDEKRDDDARDRGSRPSVPRLNLGR